MALVRRQRVDSLEGIDVRFSRMLMCFLAYVLAVIVFGAIVRATGSGAGCGNSWPLCQGNLVPFSPVIKTWIEFSHRLTSGLTLPFAFVLFLWGRKLLPAGHRSRNALKWTIAFLLLEALIGAFLVKFEHVADNPSLYRALSISLHLVNTFALMVASVGAWFWSLVPGMLPCLPGRRRFPLILTLGAAAMVCTGVSGAITALGDTLFPLTGAMDAFSAAREVSAHLFVRLRIYHPFIAVISSLLLLYIGISVAPEIPESRRIAWVFSALVGIQILLGFLNIALHAPVWMQAVHLLVAHLLWIGFVILLAQWRRAELSAELGQITGHGKRTQQG